MKNLNLLPKYLLSFIIGYMLLFNIIQIFLYLFLIVNKKLLQIELSYVKLLLLLLYLTGGVFGVRSFYKKNINYKIWKPSKSKLVINLIISLLYSVSIFFFYEGSNFRIFLISLVAAFITAYPFSALLDYYHNHPKEYKWIFLLIIINPVFTIILGLLSNLVLNR